MNASMTNAVEKTDLILALHQRLAEPLALRTKPGVRALPANFEPHPLTRPEWAAIREDHAVERFVFAAVTAAVAAALVLGLSASDDFVAGWSQFVSAVSHWIG
jgi:hypothetical protein